VTFARFAGALRKDREDWIQPYRLRSCVLLKDRLLFCDPSRASVGFVYSLLNHVFGVARMALNSPYAPPTTKSWRPHFVGR
jgi:hypothetical protein